MTTLKGYSSGYDSYTYVFSLDAEEGKTFSASTPLLYKQDSGGTVRPGHGMLAIVG